MGRRNGEFAFESWRGDGERAAVDVRDEEREEEKDEDGPESGREFFGWRRGVQGAEIVQQERRESNKSELGVSDEPEERESRFRIPQTARESE